MEQGSLGVRLLAPDSELLSATEVLPAAEE